MRGRAEKGDCKDLDGGGKVKVNFFYLLKFLMFYLVIVQYYSINVYVPSLYSLNFHVTVDLCM